MDRDPDSDTFGCLDRAFWRYSVIDYPSAWFQLGLGYLAELWLAERRFRTAPFRRWLSAGVEFTLSQRNGDGSLVEVYPYERSFCATAFGALALTRVTRVLGLSPDPRLGELGAFLADDRSSERPANQVAAAALALARLGELLGEPRFTSESERWQAHLLGREQGGLLEYGAFDAGYLTITLSVLARLEREFPGRVDSAALAPALARLDAAVGPEGRYDPSTMSRGTQFLFPLGLLCFESPVLERLAAGVAAGRTLVPAWLDDRYVAWLAADYLACANALRSEATQ